MRTRDHVFPLTVAPEPRYLVDNNAYLTRAPDPIEITSPVNERRLQRQVLSSADAVIPSIEGPSYRVAPPQPDHLNGQSAPQGPHGEVGFYATPRRRPVPLALDYPQSAPHVRELPQDGIARQPRRPRISEPSYYNSTEMPVLARPARAANVSSTGPARAYELHAQPSARRVGHVDAVRADASDIELHGECHGMPDRPQSAVGSGHRRRPSLISVNHSQAVFHSYESEHGVSSPRPPVGFYSASDSRDTFSLSRGVPTQSALAPERSQTAMYRSDVYDLSPVDHHRSHGLVQRSELPSHFPQRYRDSPSGARFAIETRREIQRTEVPSGTDTSPLYLRASDEGMPTFRMPVESTQFRSDDVTRNSSFRRQQVMEVQGPRSYELRAEEHHHFQETRPSYVVSARDPNGGPHPERVGHGRVVEMADALPPSARYAGAAGEHPPRMDMGFSRDQAVYRFEAAHPPPRMLPGQERRG